MVVRHAVLMALVGTLLATPVPAWADPDPGGPDLGQPVAAAEPVADPATPPVDDGKVMSTPPATTNSPDGWTLAISAKDEVQMPIAPLTTAISSREYAVSGVFNGALDGPGDMPKGVFEVGYQIGCGIDMSTSNGVALGGTMGVSSSLGFIGLDFPNVAAEGLLPGVGGNLGGAITVGLKPGIINIVPVTKKEYRGDRPWVSISNFHVKIDGCVGESFIRSYATLSKSTDEGDAILSWYGVTKKI
ncbi:hypothetical protein FHT44_003014 [Mycolicibacterium sp. BK634]|uniref:MspA family porin n=1 Tax=Mycolicibacterium sp. BK634 TaxID=2587099 RepID=UPI0017D136A4|nr:hypothetical protein [Mycolicibacterium sp. BK634]